MMRSQASPCCRPLKEQRLAIILGGVLNSPKAHTVLNPIEKESHLCFQGHKLSSLLLMCSPCVVLLWAKRPLSNGGFGGGIFSTQRCDLSGVN